MASLTLNPVQLASVLGALQGLFLTGVLATRRKNRTANRVLAALMGAFTIYLASNVYYGAGIVRQFPHFFGVAYPTPWLFGPLVYLYALAACDRDWRFTSRTLRHLVPAAIVTLAGLPYFFMRGADKLALLDRMTRGDLPWHVAILDPTKYVFGIGYTVATALYLRRHRLTVEQNYSNTERVNLRWLMTFASAGAAIWLLATALRLTEPLGSVGDDQVALALALLVYAVGYMGLRQPEVFRFDTMEHQVPTELVTTSAAVTSAAATDAAPLRSIDRLPDESAPAARYERSGLRDDEAEHLKSSLVTVMDREQPWKDSELTLADLAARLGSTPHKLSEVLNAQLGMTFYDFVNGYRVREVQRRIAAGDSSSLKMLALAMDAGFASKSTFNQAFKKHTNQTPSEYRQTELTR